MQGALIADSGVTDLTLPDSHEAVVRIPRSVFEAAAAALAGT